jgi:hypothetical protein
MSVYDTHDSVAMEYLGAVWNDDGGWIEYEEETNVLADLCVEHIGKTAELKDGQWTLSGEGPSMEAQVTQSKALEEIAREEVEKYPSVGMPYSDEPVRVITEDSMVTDADMFYGENYGIPVISLMGYSCGYMYDDADTMDKVAKDELVPIEKMYANILWRLLSLEKSKFDDRK